MTFVANFDDFQSEAFRALQPGMKVILAWGRGSGKTAFDRAAIHIKALQNPGLEIGLLLPTLKQARQVFWPKLLDDFGGPLKPYLKAPPNQTLLEARYVNGSRLTTWGAENANGIRGQRFGFVVSDEVDDMDPGVEAAVVEPTFSRAGSSAIWLKSGTPLRGRHGILFRDFQLGQRNEPGYWAQRVRSDESPWVDQDWLERVKANTPPAVFRREYECDFDSAEGLVYGDVFDEKFHVKEPPPGVEFARYAYGVDHGWADAGVILLGGITGHGDDAVLWVLDEIYRTETPNTDWDNWARAWFESYPGTFWADPSRPDRIDALRRAGCNPRPADNSIEAGVSRVADLFFRRKGADDREWARLYISPKCANTIRELGEYRRKKDPRNPDHYLDAIEDRNNHAMDALRYLVVGEFGRGENFRNVVSGR